MKISDKTYTFEAKRYPWYFLEAYGKNGAQAEIRLVKVNLKSIGKDPYGWFTRKKISNDVHAFESQRYPGYFLAAWGKRGPHAKIRLLKAEVDNIGSDPWGWFTANKTNKIVYSTGTKISNHRTVAFESKRYSGYFLDAHSVSGPNAKIRLRRESVEGIGHDPWGWFTAVQISNDIFALESKRYPGFFLDAHSRNGSYAAITLSNASVWNIGGDPWGWFTQKTIDQDAYAFESRRYPGFFLDAHSANGKHA